MALYEKYLWNSNTNTWELVEISISQVAGLQGVLDGKAPLPLASLRNFVNGTTIHTSIDYSQSSGAPFLLKIYGNTYSRLIPTETVIQGYIYNDTIINYSGYSVGNPITGLVALNVGGKLTFWFPRQGYWEGYFAEVFDVGGAGGKVNLVTSILDTTKPTGTKEVTFSNIVNVVLNSDPRLTNARPASDVHAWAKAENKPSYNLDQISDGTTYKRVTQSEKNTWNGKQNALGYTPENAANKRTSIRTSGADNASYVSELGVKTYVDGLINQGFSDYLKRDGSNAMTGWLSTPGVTSEYFSFDNFDLGRAAIMSKSGGGVNLLVKTGDESPDTTTYGFHLGMANFGGAKITNLGTPLAANDAATKEYVDGLVIKPVYTQIFMKSTLGNFSIPNYTKYSMYLVHTLIVASGIEVESYQSGFISNDNMRFSAPVYDMGNQAMVYINASVSGSTFRIDDVGQMPWVMIPGTKSFQVTLWGVEFKL